MGSSLVVNGDERLVCNSTELGDISVRGWFRCLVMRHTRRRQLMINPLKRVLGWLRIGRQSRLPSPQMLKTAQRWDLRPIVMTGSVHHRSLAACHVMKQGTYLYLSRSLRRDRGPGL
jgi:hypothetical protein